MAVQTGRVTKTRARKKPTSSANRPVKFGEYRLFGKKGSEGVQWTCAGNIAHPYAEDMHMPDYSDVSLKITKRTVKISEGIRKAVKGDLIKVAYDRDVRTIKNNECDLVQEFKMAGLSVRRYKFHDIDHKDGDSYTKAVRSQAVEKKLDDIVGAKRPRELVQWVMAKIMREDQEPRKAKEKYKNLRLEALEYMYEHKAEHIQLEEEMKKGDPTLDVFLAELKEKDHGRKDPYLQYDRDQEAGRNTDILERVEKNVVIFVDKNDELIAMILSSLAQVLYSEEGLATIVEGFDLYTHYQRVTLPVGGRHALLGEHLKENPHVDMTAAGSDPHTAKAGNIHHGTHEQIGNPSGDRADKISLTYETYLDDHMRNHQIRNIVFDDFRYGAYGNTTEIAKFAFRVACPELYRDYVEVQNALPESRRWITTLDDPFTLRALLVNLSTEDHTDDCDWTYGIAALVTMGEYEGGDLVLRELGVRIASPPGSLTLLRGSELSHSITKWTGKCGYCIVHTTHDAVMRYSYQLMGRALPLFKYQAKERLGCINEPTDEDDIYGGFDPKDLQPRGPPVIYESSEELTDEERN